MTATTELHSPKSGEPQPLHRPLHTEPSRAEPSHEHHDEPELKRPTKTWSAASLILTILIAAAGFGGLFLLGSVPRHHSNAVLAEESDRVKTSRPRVRVMTPRQSPAITEAMLPGDVQAMEETILYPRTNGYVTKWLVDIGDEVNEGQLLAEISTPEVFAQLQQSKAALSESKASVERAKATVNLTTITTNRLRGLVAKNTVSQQELDDAEGNQAVAVANLRLAEATVEANTANMQHMQELQSFSEITAPFSGTITARNINTGQLVTSGNGTGQSLFQLTRTNPVRVFVNVPQIYAPGVTKGMKADIIVREIPGRIFPGTVTRTARAIDATTRTLLTEIQVPNDDRALLTGSYVQVKMDVARQDPPLMIPASALVFNAQGTQVAVVDSDETVRLCAVEVAGDFGREVGISTGIRADDQVIVNPGDRMSDGLKVQIDPDQELDSKAPVQTPSAAPATTGKTH
ncbi:efflux RND transporter periplasmic adaptor subunit [Schlesneria paludicola]|uniref:efflux RND transporter periplasmic adaptor subunit n=1 Tax=Schlesneria paludicola TaxID=360056 RepID=UPI00029A37CB|nr:efflux RND transporter periplasmic adaptor subunit [Schlesneria paludicola]